MGNQNKPYITLKEASEISGYSPDYIGQLIRNGKIEGKQVFSNVAWVTTEEEVRSYAERESGRQNQKNASADKKDLLTLERMRDLYTFLGKGFLIALGLFLLLPLYVLSVSVDQRIEQSFLENIYHGTS